MRWARTIAAGLLLQACGASAVEARADEPSSVDCAEAKGEVQQAICADFGLAALDRKLAGVYAQARSRAARDPADLRRLESIQRGWIKGRDACWKADDRRACAELEYKTRIAQLQAEYGLLEPVGHATWRCADGSELASSFYASDPPYARFERGGRSVIAAIAESGSGSRYASPADRFEYWEHQGEATLSWDGRETKCRKP
jgi:uncharacterized protein